MMRPNVACILFSSLTDFNVNLIFLHMYYTGSIMYCFHLVKFHFDKSQASCILT